MKRILYLLLIIIMLLFNLLAGAQKSDPGSNGHIAKKTIVKKR